MQKTNSQYRLSIITINRNDAIGLEQTIKSVINQSSKDFEFIIIDGASEDNSVEIINHYQESLDCWISEKDSGIYNAMNKGLAKANGEYCLFLNSGDCLIDNNAINQILENKLETDIIAFGCLMRNKNKNLIHIPPRNVTLYTFTCGSLPHPSTLIRTSYIKKNNGYSEDYKIISDWKFFFESLIVRNCSFSSYSFVTSIFDGINGISSTNPKGEEIEKNEILKLYYPKIIDDYYLENKVSYEYFSNVFYYLNNNKILLKLIFPFVRIFNFSLKCRNKNPKLIKILRG